MNPRRSSPTPSSLLANGALISMPLFEYVYIQRCPCSNMHHPNGACFYRIGGMYCDFSMTYIVVYGNKFWYQKKYTISYRCKFDSFCSKQWWQKHKSASLEADAISCEVNSLIFFPSNIDGNMYLLVCKHTYFFTWSKLILHRQNYVVVWMTSVER
jgi:hypothetical protein